MRESRCLIKKFTMKIIKSWGRIGRKLNCMGRLSLLDLLNIQQKGHNIVNVALSKFTKIRSPSLKIRKNFSFWDLVYLCISPSLEIASSCWLCSSAPTTSFRCTHPINRINYFAMSCNPIKLKPKNKLTFFRKLISPGDTSSRKVGKKNNLSPKIISIFNAKLGCFSTLV